MKKLMLVLCVIFTIIGCTPKETEIPKMTHAPPSIERVLLAIVEVESGGNSTAIGNGECIGVAQINYRVWGKTLREEGIVKSKKDLFKKDINLNAARFILTHYLEKENGNIHRALYRYSGRDRFYPKKVFKILRRGVNNG